MVSTETPGVAGIVCDIDIGGNVAITLAQPDRYLDDREYARAARDGFASCGSGATGDVRHADELIERIKDCDTRAKG